MWERANAPMALPAELRALLEVSNGFSLTWALDQVGEELPFGSMRLNELSQIKRVDIDPVDIRHASAPRPAGRAPPASQPPPTASTGEDGARLTAFDLDATARDGRLCLIYGLPGSSCPQVWFQDLSRGWWFVARGFAEYLRLLLMHLGLPRWQHAYTETGLDPNARYWIRLIAPHRLIAAQPGARRDGGDSHRRSDLASPRPWPNAAARGPDGSGRAPAKSTARRPSSAQRSGGRPVRRSSSANTPPQAYEPSGAGF
jgi:tubulin polyglutamylase complex subunit 2